MASSAKKRWSSVSTIRPRCRALNSLRRSTSRGWRSCRWRINPVRRGITAWPPMCSAVCSKWCTDKTSTPCCASASPGRSPCVIPASRRRPPAMHVSPSLLSTKKPAGAFTDATLPNRRNALAAVVASAADYVRFCQMLLNGGELDGVRLLSKSTVALMTANHLPADIRYISFLPARPGDALAGGGAGLGAGLCGAHRRGQEPAARFGRRILLERRVRHGVLGRSEGTNDRHHDGAGTCAAALASAAVSGNRELNGRAAPRGGGRS